MDGPLPKWCLAVALSRQDGRHSAIALLLKAALIQVSDYRLLGASGLFRKFHKKVVHFMHTILPSTTSVMEIPQNLAWLHNTI